MTREEKIAIISEALRFNSENMESVVKKSDAQLDYVLSPIDKCVYLEACAGSGKTEVLGIKAAYEIQKWESCYSGIAVLSFTNEATATITDRIMKFHHNSIPANHYVGTFSSFIQGYITQRFGYSIYGSSEDSNDMSFRVISSDTKQYTNQWLENYRIATAEAELGYLEKKSNKNLDDKTANAGSNNYTKYNRDLKAWTGVGSISAQWCQAFVDWAFITAFGLEAAKKLIYVWTNYTPTGSGAFKKKGRYIKRGSGKPKRGDVIYFYSSAKGRIGHVGIVYKVSGSKVYTVEGNTSGASSLVTNGGGVKKKSYSMSSTYIDGYGSVDYSAVEGMVYTEPENPVVKLGDRVLYNYTEGDDVKELQQSLISLGFDCGSYGADGEYGDCTEMAVSNFQQAHGLAASGKYDAATHAALTAALAGQPGDVEATKAKYVEIQTNKQCYVRTQPNTDGDKLGIAHSGDRLPYLGTTYDNGWFSVRYKDKEACVSGKYARLVE